MKVYELNIINLIDKVKDIDIPFFQRNYVWSFDEQIEELIFDIFSNELEFYYLGNIILKSKEEKYSIIDGQQRITTFLLILKAISEMTSFTSDNVSPEYFYKINDLLCSFKYNSYNVENSNILMSILNNEKITNENSVYYVNYSCIKKYLNNTFNNPEILVNLINKIYKSYFAVTVLDNNVDETKIFSQINSTGKKLSAYDLFKNSIMYNLISIFKTENNYDSNKLYKFINDRVQEIDYINNSFTKEEQSSELLRSFLAKITFFIPSKKKIYSFYKEQEKIHLKNSSIFNFYEDYLRFGIIYKYIFLDEYQNDFTMYDFELIKNEFNTYCYLLINVFLEYSTIDIKKQKIYINDKESILECLKIIEHYIIYRKFSINHSDKEITRRIPNINDEIEKLLIVNNKLNFIEALYLSLIWFPINSNVDHKYRTITDEELSKSINIKYISETNASFVKSFLVKLSYKIEKKITIDFNNSWTIEHILPRNLAQWINDGFNENIDSCKEYLHTIGNLTLTKYNSEISNKPFLEKIKFIKENEGFVLNNDIFDKTYWGVNNIKERTNCIYSLIKKYWNLSNIEKNISSKYNLDEIINPIKITSNIDKNISHFIKIYNRDNSSFSPENIVFLLRKYIELGSGEKLEEEIFNENFKGWIINSLKKYLNIHEKSKEEIAELLNLNMINTESCSNYILKSIKNKKYK